MSIVNILTDYINIILLREGFIKFYKLNIDYGLSKKREEFIRKLVERYEEELSYKRVLNFIECKSYLVYNDSDIKFIKNEYLDQPIPDKSIYNQEHIIVAKYKINDVLIITAKIPFNKHLYLNILNEIQYNINNIENIILRHNNVSKGLDSHHLCEDIEDNCVISGIFNVDLYIRESYKTKEVFLNNYKSKEIIDSNDLYNKIMSGIYLLENEMDTREYVLKFQNYIINRIDYYIKRVIGNREFTSVNEKLSLIKDIQLELNIENLINKLHLVDGSDKDKIPIRYAFFLLDKDDDVFNY